MSLYGIYGSHTPEACPVNNRKIAELLVAFAKSDIVAVLGKYRINNVIGQYHSALEHTFIWIVDAQDSHLIQQFCIDTGIASFNNLKIVPMITFGAGVIPLITKIHEL